MGCLRPHGGMETALGSQAANSTDWLSSFRQASKGLPGLTCSQLRVVTLVLLTSLKLFNKDIKVVWNNWNHNVTKRQGSGAVPVYCLHFWPTLTSTKTIPLWPQLLHHGATRGAPLIPWEDVAYSMRTYLHASWARSLLPVPTGLVWMKKGTVGSFSCEMCESASIIGIKLSVKGLQLAIVPLSETLSDFQKASQRPHWMSQTPRTKMVMPTFSVLIYS